MLSFTVANARTCLQPDDIEAINLLYPVCSGRAMVRDTASAWGCHKGDARIGYVRVIVYLLLPVALIYTVLMMVSFE